MLSPAERLAFVLHDVFGLAFREIAEILDRTEPAVRQLASRGRSRVRDAPAVTGRRADAGIVDAWLEAATEGRFEALLELLDEGAVPTADDGTIRGGRIVGLEVVADPHRLAHLQLAGGSG